MKSGAPGGGKGGAASQGGLGKVAQFAIDPRAALAAAGQKQGSQENQNSQQGPGMQAVDNLLNAACPTLAGNCTQPQPGDAAGLETFSNCLQNFMAPDSPHCDWLFSEIKNRTILLRPQDGNANQITPFRALMMAIASGQGQDQRQGSITNLTNVNITSSDQPGSITNLTNVNVTIAAPRGTFRPRGSSRP
jgi:hypothetical protein